MQKAIKGLAGVGLVVLAALLIYMAVPDSMLRQRAPNITFPLLDGRQLTLSSLAGKPVLVTFWATSCVECRKEMPEMIALYQELSGSGFEIIAVAMPYDPPNRVLETSRDNLSPDFAAALEAAAQIPRSVSEQLPLERTQLFRRVQQLFETADLIVSPTIAAPSIALEHGVTEPLLIDGEVAGSLREAWYPYAGVANLTGHPAISVPMGLAADGTPAGLHAMARLQEDHRLIELAAAIEVLRPWAAQWPACDPVA